jgi:hypothetical protein
VPPAILGGRLERVLNGLHRGPAIWRSGLDLFHLVECERYRDTLAQAGPSGKRCPASDSRLIAA